MFQFGVMFPFHHRLLVMLPVKDLAYQCEQLCVWVGVYVCVVTDFYILSVLFYWLYYFMPAV